MARWVTVNLRTCDVTIEYIHSLVQGFMQDSTSFTYLNLKTYLKPL
jgi:hypothetical protein